MLFNQETVWNKTTVWNRWLSQPVFQVFPRGIAVNFCWVTAFRLTVQRRLTVTLYTHAYFLYISISDIEKTSWWRKVKYSPWPPWQCIRFFYGLWVEANDGLLLPSNGQTWYRQSSDVNYHVEHLQKAFLYVTDLYVAFCETHATQMKVVILRYF